MSGEEKKVNLSPQELAKLLSDTVEQTIKSAQGNASEYKLASEPFVKKTQAEEDAERYGPLISRPKSKTEAKKLMKFFETGTFIDELFLAEDGKPANGVPVVVQMGIVGLPDVGKSILVQEIALKAASKGKRVAFVPSEDAWELPNARFDLQSRFKQKADSMGLDWEDIRNSLFVFDTINHSQLRDWRTFVGAYRYIVEVLGGIDLLILDSITVMETHRGALKNRLLNLARYNQQRGITALYVCQRSLEKADEYAIAGGIGLAHNLDATICIDFKKASGQLKADLNETRPKDKQIKQWDVVHFIRMLGCRLCGFDRRYYEAEISQDGFLKLRWE